MKNFTKFLLAVAALVAVSCATDATADLGVQVNGAEQTEIILSLESSRTQLGTEVDGLYPLFWSEGDQISVNGIASNALTAQQAGGSKAGFTLAGALSTPYCIAYPAANEGQVVFASEQTHAGNTTFASGVSTMYAYSENGSEIQLHHLTGVLKIGVTGSANIVLAQVSTIDRAPIAGTFDFDFVKGEATATAASKSVIEYSFGEGVQLSTEPTYMHLAVPAGVYGELYVTLYDAEGGVMYATIKADDAKPLNAGAVRTFSSHINYAANATVFVVKDKATLKAFAEQAASLDKDVIFAADVDMRGEAWTPIEGYARNIIGNGYAIKGLTAPLFGTTSASIKGLHLEGVNITETANPNVAAFARTITAANGVVPSFSHCSASGKIVVNCPSYLLAEGADALTTISVGGLVGNAMGVAISDCTNNVELDIQQSMSLNGTILASTNVGGIVGCANIAGEVLTSVVDCVNKAKVSLNSAVTNQANNYQEYMAAGVMGYLPKANGSALVKNLTNYGAITISGKFIKSGRGTAYQDVGGVIGRIDNAANISYLYNYGTVDVLGGYYSYLRVGGVLGFATLSTSSYLYNYGALTASADATVFHFCSGGIAGSYCGENNEKDILTNATNDAPLTYSCKVDKVAKDTALYYRIGGITGWCQGVLEDCTNAAKGVISILGELHNADTSNYGTCIGGIVGYKTVVGGNRLTNKADIIFNTNMTTAEGTEISKVRLNMGGVFGYATYGAENASNSGNITVSGNLAGDLRLGGLGGQMSQAFNLSENNGTITVKANTTVGSAFEVAGITGCHNGECGSVTNNGDIIIEANVTAGGAFYVSGVLGYLNNNAEGLVNNGNITIGSGLTVNGTAAYIGGCVGSIANKTSSTSYTNNGSITLNGGSYKDHVYLSGCVGYGAKGGSYTQLYNNGAITAKGKNSASTLYLGGTLGRSEADGSGTFTVCENNAPIDITFDIVGTTYIGGVAAYLNLSNSAKSLYNREKGDITVNITNHKVDKDVNVGGILAGMRDKSNGHENYGDITVTGNMVGNVLVSGIVCMSNNYTRTNLVNDCTITIDAEIGGDLRVGGMGAGGEYGGENSNCQNKGAIIITKDTKIQGSVHIGGMWGLNYKDTQSFMNCHNSATIIFDGQSGLNGAAESVLSIGGIMGECHTATGTLSGGIYNSGNISYGGSHKGAGIASVGGIIGAQNVAPDTAWSDTVLNIGNITCTGTFAAEAYAGGIAGSSTVGIAASQCHCNLTALGYTGVGMITGSSRVNESVVATNCQIGGAIFVHTLVDKEDELWGDILADITNDNFHNYIYGSGEATDWTGTDNYDGCSFLAEKPTIE